MNNNNILNLLGLAYRAKKLVIGSDDVLLSIKDNTIKLVLIDKDMMSNTSKEITYFCEKNNIVLVRNFTKEELSHSIGKKNISVIGIIDEGFKNLIMKSL